GLRRISAGSLSRQGAPESTYPNCRSGIRLAGRCSRRRRHNLSIAGKFLLTGRQMRLNAFVGFLTVDESRRALTRRHRPGSAFPGFSGTEEVFMLMRRLV